MYLQALSTSVSCYIADWNETHVKNPNWPPHARFHNGQTMSLGLLLGLVTAWYTSKAAEARRQGYHAEAKEALWVAAVVGSLYWVAGCSAILYPGTLWVSYILPLARGFVP
jgi:hypothetical protein